MDLAAWLSPLGTAVRLFFVCFTLKSLQALRWRDVAAYSHWMGLRSFHFVSLASVVVAMALTIQTTLELKRYQAEDLTGAAIAIGLLRELGPLTISIAWCVRVSALIAEEARNYKHLWQNEEQFAAQFILPRYVAALLMSIPLAGYGLVVGFITAGVVAPLLGVSSLNYFVDSARDAIRDRDIIVYFIKLSAINPLVGAFAGAVCGWKSKDVSEPVAANAVTATYIGCLILNLAITVASYLEGDFTL